MTDPKRPADPFANLVNLGTDQKLFTAGMKTTPPASEPTSETTQEGTQNPTRDIPHIREAMRATTREPSRESSRHTQRSDMREKPRDSKRLTLRNLPSRDAIQEFSFHLRDELKVKVQAEVPADWQKELEDTAHRLDVGKIELYRYILGTFLGKVEPEDVSDEP